MLDLNRTLDLLKGAMFDPERTWDGYRSDAEDWQKTAFLLTGPLVVGAAVLAYVLGMVFPSAWLGRPGFGSMLMSIVVSAAAAAVIAFVVSLLAGAFKGRASFPLALAATSLAFVPGYAGRALSPLPWVGWLLSFGLGIYGLVLLWQILPRYLDVPAESRVAHYVLSLIVSVVAFIVVGAMLGAGAATKRIGDIDYGPGSRSERSGDEDPGERAPGFLNELERQGNMFAAAEADTFEPPADGKLSEAQVRHLIDVLTKTHDYRADQAEQLKTLGERAEQDSIESIGEVFAGMKGVMNITTAEMEVVKTGGGNWAEHQWVKEQLHIASIQKDINEAVAHNYALYQEYQEPLRTLDAF